MNSDIIRTWCYICNDYVDSQLNEESNELNCTICGSTFVEEANQNIEGFLNINSSANEQNEVTNSTITESSILDSNSPGGYQHLPNNDIQGRPIGVIIRQAPGSSNDISSLSDLLRNIGENRDNPHAGILNLLGSLLNTRNITNMDSLDENSRFDQFLHHILMNENSHSGAPPASKDLIDNLPREYIKGDTDIEIFGECSISQEAFQVGDTVVSLPCGHKYKEEPIIHWLEMHNTCPVCRVVIEN